MSEIIQQLFPDPAMKKYREKMTRLQDEYNAAVEKHAAAGTSKAADTRLDTQSIIRQVCGEIEQFLLTKNEQYGDSAINPVRIFSKGAPDEQLLVRIDDKLSRIARGDDRLESDDDVLNDLIGYLILYKVAKRK